MAYQYQATGTLQKWNLRLQMITARQIKSVKHLWVKKATGLGVTEFMLRFMSWLCLCNDDYRNSQMVIVTGPNQELAIKLIKRMKTLFEPLGIIFDSKETVLLNTLQNTDNKIETIEGEETTTNGVF
jgi:hypothetical protein